MTHNLAKSSVYLRSHAPAAAGATVLNGSTLSPGGAQNALGIVDFGTIGAIAGSPVVKWQQSVDAGSNWTDITGASVPLTTADSGKLVVLELVAVKQATIRLVIDRGGTTNSMVVNSAVVVLHNDRVQPVPVASIGDASQAVATLHGG